MVGFFFSSLCLFLAVAAPAEDTAKGALTAAEVLALELEAKLASKPDLYVVVDLQERTFKVKSRGVELTSVKLASADFLHHEHAGSQAVAPITVPSVLTIAGRAPAGERRVILPRELRPYSEEDEGAPALPNPKPGERLHKAPSEYRVRIENGWWLEIAQVSPVPPPGFEAFKARVRQGWDNLLGGRTEEPPLFFLELPAEDARRIHHLFRPGRAILVTH
ncbi:MAG: hypothetical protein SF066_17925, partial [Thermoanaerobaculia bacterium]|nr:hypothetical protein [Thermoanaerobaculia bacterium]